MEFDYQGLLGALQPTDDDRKRAMQMGLLQAGLGILAANNRRAAGSALGVGGLAGLQGYQSALNQAQQQRAQQLPMAMKIAEMQRAEEQRRALSRVFGGGQSGMIQTSASTGGQPGGFNRVAATDYLQLGGDPVKLKTMQDLLVNKTKRSVEGGKVVITDEYGNTVGTEDVTPLPPSKPQAPWQYSDLTPEQVRAHELLKAQKSAPNLSQKTIMVQETEQAKNIGKYYGEMYADLQKQSMNAGVKSAKLDRMSQLLEGVSTGKLTPAITEVTAIADSLGIKIDPKLGAKQALEALSNEVALTLRGTGEGGGMPGAMSDKDREFLKAMTPSLSNTPEGNRLIIETSKKLIKRQQDVARLARDYRKKNDGSLDGFEAVVQEFADKNPMFEGSVVPGVTTKPPASTSGFRIVR